MTNALPFHLNIFLKKAPVFQSASSLGAFFDLLGLHLESISEKDLNDNLSPLLDFLFSTLTLRSQIETQASVLCLYWWQLVA